MGALRLKTPGSKSPPGPKASARCLTSEARAFLSARRNSESSLLRLNVLALAHSLEQVSRGRPAFGYGGRGRVHSLHVPVMEHPQGGSSCNQRLTRTLWTAWLECCACPRFQSWPRER